MVSISRSQFSQLINIFIAQYGKLSLQLVGLSFLARKLDTIIFGYAAFGLIIFEFGKILCDFGIFKKIVQTRKIPRLQLIKYGNTSLLLSLIYLLVASIAIYFSPLNTISEMYIYALAPIIYLFSNVNRARLEKCRKYKTIRDIEIISTACGVLSACALALLVRSDSLLPLAIQVFLSAIINSFLINFYVKSLSSKGFSMSSWEELQSLRDILQGDLVHYMYKSLDKVIIGAFLGVVLLGVYVLFYRFISLPYQLFVSVVNRVMLPNIVKAPMNKKFHTLLMFGGLIFIPLILLIGIVLLNKEFIIYLIYGEAYQVYASLVTFAMLAAFAQTISSMYSVYILACKMNKQYLKFLFMQSIFSIFAIFSGSLISLEHVFIFYAIANIITAAYALIYLTKNRYI